MQHQASNSELLFRNISAYKSFSWKDFVEQNYSIKGQANKPAYQRIKKHGKSQLVNYSSEQ